jgi:hypothetical protein
MQGCVVDQSNNPLDVDAVVAHDVLQGGRTDLCIDLNRVKQKLVLLESFYAKSSL